MDRRYGRVPRWLELLQPAEETRRVEARRAYQAGAGGHGGQQCADQAMDMEERHHAQAAVGGSQSQRLPDVSRRGRHVPVGQRNPLGPGRGPRCMQNQGDVVRACQSRRSGRGSFRAVEVEYARSPPITGTSSITVIPSRRAASRAGVSTPRRTTKARALKSAR